MDALTQHKPSPRILVLDKPQAPDGPNSMVHSDNRLTYIAAFHTVLLWDPCCSIFTLIHFLFLKIIKYFLDHDD